MQKITVNDAVARQLEGTSAPVEFYSESGRYLGRYVPLAPSKDPLDDFHLTPQQLEEALNQTGGRPLADIWKDLGRE